MTMLHCIGHKASSPRRKSGSSRGLFWIPAFAGMTALIFLISGQAMAFGKSDTGTSGAAFLKIGPGARPAAMGEAFTGVADDIHSIYWNPAGLATLDHPELTAMHMQWFQSIDYEFASFAYPMKDGKGTWGLSIQNLHTDDIQRRTEDTDEAIDEFGASDSAYGISYAYPLSDRLSLGSNFKFIRQTLDSVHANAYAMDAGVLYDIDWHSLRLGGSIQNLGTKIKFVSESDPLPLTIRLGASVQPIPKRILLSSDLIFPRDHEIGIALGGEYRKPISKTINLSARTGYRSDTDVSGFAGVSAGGGIEVGRVSFDFTWVPFGDLGNSYRYALHIKFGPTGAKDDKDPNILQTTSNNTEPPLNFLPD
jgi:hypothetical protein